MSNTYNHNYINQSREQMAGHQLVALQELHKLINARQNVNTTVAKQFPGVIAEVSPELVMTEATTPIEMQSNAAYIAQLAGDQAVIHSTSYPRAA